MFFIRNLGFCEPTAARRIGFEESLEFERTHEESYRALGHELVDIPAGSLTGRIRRVATPVMAAELVGPVLWAGRKMSVGGSSLG